MDQSAQPVPNPLPQFVVRDVYDDPLSNAKRATGAFSLDRIEPAEVPWLWPHRIPLGSVTLLVGDPGVGKSLLALDIAARISRGYPWPDHESQIRASANSGNELRGGDGNSERGRDSVDTARRDTPSPTLLFSPSSVLLINAEDLMHRIIRPRLDALGADCSRIIAWAYVRDEMNIVGEPHLFGLTRDLNSLDLLLGAMPDCQLLILDPITALLGEASEHTSGDVWKLLTTLAQLALKHGLAVLVISHFRKKEGAGIHRALGSLAFVAAARAVWAVVKDTDDPTKRQFLPLKNNFAPETKGLAFTIETSPANAAATIRWHPDRIEVADLTFAPARVGGRPDDERQYAMNWLRTRLAEGPTPVREILSDADAHCINRMTLRRAFRELKGEAIRNGPFPHGEWKWKLPIVDDQNPQGESFDHLRKTSMNLPS